MKKIYLFLVVLLFSFIYVSAQPATIYDQIKEIRVNPAKYTLVIGKKADIEEVKSASELAGFLGIRRSNFASKIKSHNNLVIVGLLENNEKIAEDAAALKGMLIKVEGNNLIVSGSTVNDLKNAVEIVKNHEKNKARLLRNKIASINLFAPLKEIFSSMAVIYIVSILLLIASSTALIIHHKRALEKPGPAAASPAYIKLSNYVAENLRKGYTEAQIRSILSRSGWKSDLLDSIFNEIRSFYRK